MAATCHVQVPDTLIERRAGVMEDLENPCIGICIIGEDGRCEGCGRTEDEIYGTPEAAVADATLIG